MAKKVQKPLMPRKQKRQARPPDHKAGSVHNDLKKTWKAATQRLGPGSPTHRQWEADRLRNKSPLYLELHKIWEATGDVVFSTALHGLFVYGLDTAKPRRNLKQVQQALGPPQDYELSIAGISKCLQYFAPMTVRKAAPIVTAQLALYLDANSFEAAQDHVRKNWTRFKMMNKDNVDLKNSLAQFVRPLKITKEALDLVDPYSLIKLQASGMLVRHSPYWDYAQKNGLVTCV